MKPGEPWPGLTEEERVEHLHPVNKPSPRGYRDLYWCDVLNEPFIIEYRDGKPFCTHCAGDITQLSESHPFLDNIRRRMTDAELDADIARLEADPKVQAALASDTKPIGHTVAGIWCVTIPESKFKAIVAALMWYAWPDRYVPRFEGVGRVGLGPKYVPQAESDLGKLARDVLGGVHTSIERERDVRVTRGILEELRSGKYQSPSG